jgi:hypothetical protein
VTAVGYSAVSGKAAWLFFVVFNLLAVIVLFKCVLTPAAISTPHSPRHI